MLLFHLRLRAAGTSSLGSWAALAKYVRRYFWWSREQEIRLRERSRTSTPPLTTGVPHPLTRAWLVLASVGALMLGLVIFMIVVCD